MPKVHKLDPERWFTEYGDYLFNFTITRVKDAEIAEDIIQSALLSAWRARETFAGRSSEKTWLTSIIRNKIIDHYRKNGREKQYVVDLSNEGSGSEEDYFNAHGIWKKNINNWADQPDEQINNEEFMQVFADCVDKIPESMQNVYRMKYLEHLPAEEICELLEISASNYWTILYRIRVRLRSCLNKNWYNSNE